MARKKERIDIDAGRLLRDRRNKLNFSMLQVAEYCGVSESTISRWETGRVATIKRTQILKLSEILNLSIESIIGLDDITREVSVSAILKREKVARLVRKCSEEQLDDIIRFIESFILTK